MRGEGIKKLSDLFDKYKNTLKAPQASVVKAFCEVVDEVLDITIEPTDIKYNVYNKTINLRVSGIIKTEIKIHQEEILAHLKGRLGVDNAPKTIL